MPTNEIKIRGIIVPSFFDDSMFEEDIEKGLITPESRVAKAIENADPSKPIEIRIDSPGGSVFSANEMVNLLAEWRIRNQQPVNVTVGAMAASAASMIALMFGPVTAHANSMFMFHSAASVQMGGPEAMGDMRDLLDKINRRITTTLVNKYKADPDLVAEWFAEGRMGWLDMEGAKAIGLIDKEIKTDAEIQKFGDDSMARLQQNGLQVAALIEINDNIGENTMETLMEKIKSLFGIEMNAEEPDAIVDDLEAAQKKAQDQAYDEGLNAGKLEASKEEAEKVRSEMQTKLDEVNSALVTANKTVEQQKKDLDETSQKLKTANERIKQLDKGFLDDGDNEPDGTVGSYWDAVDALVKDGSSKDAAIRKVNQEHPELKKQMLKEANENNKQEK